MSAPKTVFVLVHGAWHNRSAWDKITSLLETRGFAALALDLPGAGVHAIAPASLGRRPFDAAAFAAEPSPTAGITQEERTEAVVALVKDAASRGDGKVILVGHSAGGMTISAVAERVPSLLRAVVYIAGFMVPKGLTLLDLQQIGDVGLGHITARQELREMIAGLGIPGADEQQKLAATG